MKTYPHVETITQKIKFMREAGAVRRCHTMPVIGEYNVGIHVYNMLSMLRILWTSAPNSLIWAILEHDAPERLTGDIPAPVKWFGIIDREILDKIEQSIMLDTLEYDYIGELSKNEQAWFHSLDIFELALFCRDQIMLGNRNFEVMLERIHKYVTNNSAKLEPIVLDVYWESLKYDWSMLPDLGDV